MAFLANSSLLIQRTPFASIHNRQDRSMAASSASSSRLRDSPMDFAYDAPTRQRQSTSRAWLDGAAQAMEVEDDDEENGGQQPLSPTVAGPDIDMLVSDGGVQDERKLRHAGAAHADDSDRKPVSYGVLTRSARQRTAARPVQAGHPRRRTTKSSARVADLSADHEDEDATLDEAEDSVEWQDEEEERYALGSVGRKERPRRRSLRKRMGDTLNIRYYFNNDAGLRSGRDFVGHELHQDTAKMQIVPPSRWTDPEWCLGMAQFGFNATILLAITYLLFNVIVTLQRDVSSKVREYELEYLAEIEACSQNFHLNRCGTAGAVPALASACASWQRCSARNPANVGRARVAAETVAEIVNGFVDVVSWKSMLFTLAALVIVVGATTSFLSFFRIRSRRTDTSSEGSKADRALHPSHSGALPFPDHSRSSQQRYGQLSSGHDRRRMGR